MTTSAGTQDHGRRIDTQHSTETKASMKTSEFFVFLAAAALVLIAGYIVDGFTASETWRYFTYLAVGYMISRGLAKAGSKEPYRD
jgi:ABC-type multidrug transport system permease subunit